ncbi:ParB family chromosome partitioning protein [Nitrospirillum amazonense]|uniref:ParB family chromosome partitioning protein n=1 Tax=Nitrospirillum amazonense TaxID=28077 RepID=A0A560FPE8_9PROT|nr:ParB/RepB/Spo0J family partition protein [Nitrospirillum amazonense]TWB23472.1 ParB family chromosome partitioning protein [Nitrospirillum amazonense]
MGELLTLPLSKLSASDANMRKTARDSGLEELAASIAAHGLLQNLTVRPVLDGHGRETGRYEVVAGGRRLAALKLLAQRKRLPKAAPVPCALLGTANALEVSLAENSYVPPHPADQFEAFHHLHAAEGLPALEIAARFGVAERTVKQRLKLGAVSPRLMAQYREGLMTLEQLTAFALTDDHARQEQVWGDLTWNKSADTIRRLLTQAHVPATDRRVRFVGIAAYEAAGGPVLRDLFSADDQGVYLEDVPLLDRLVAEKLEADAVTVRAEGWKWVAVHPEFAYGLAAGLRRAYPVPAPLDANEQAALDALERDYEALSNRLEGDASPEADTAFQDLEARIAALRDREAYDPDDIARGGAFVCLGADGALRVERGFIRPEDEAPPEPIPEPISLPVAQDEPEVISAAAEEETDGLTPLSERLVEELTTHRTAGLQAALMDRPDVALAAVVHALALPLFHGGGYLPQSCLRLETAPVVFINPVADGSAARAVASRHDDWARQLPSSPDELWAWVLAQETAVLARLLAFCVATLVHGVQAPWSHDPRRLAHADALATVLDLDMTRHWSATVDSYLGRVTKARIVEAVGEGVSARDAEAISGLKKGEMAEQAERLLAGKPWLPALLRTVRREPAPALDQAAE